MSTPIDVRRAGAAVVDQSRAVFEDARKSLYAVVGAGDLAVSRTATQLRELPAETQSAVDSGVRQVRARIEELRAEVTTLLTDLRGKTADLPDKAAGRAPTPTEFRSRVEAYLDKAKEFYEDLAVRGERVVTKVSDRPGVKSAVGRAESLFDRAGDGATHAARDTKAAVRTAPRRRTAASNSPASTSPTGKSSVGERTAGKTSAGKTSAGKSPARRSSAK